MLPGGAHVVARHSVPLVVVLVVALSIAFGLSAAAQDLGAAFKASYAAEAAGNYDEAWRVMNEAIGRDRSSYAGVMRLAYLKTLMQKPAEAAQLYTFAAGLQPRAVEPLLYLQYQYLVLQDWTKLVEASSSALQIDPNNYNSRARLGYAYYNQQRYAEAAAEYTKVSQLYPLDLDIMVMRGWSHALSGRKALAQQAFQKVLEVSPDNASAQEGITFLSRMR